ncbi:hypothetical protein RirG_121410 [Rhizophagus irregularis DAOM 197198w]|uniref:Uncharacterized protein n=1 Tax=Rhizophagus irregularis (strain DAOM 197198w) TaxID=1432141 RepID=A0A015MIN2_RHIIW|nr:hypothetical protein RirG_121410 [Rhizophagus irregularis DAOM 197198w]
MPIKVVALVQSLENHLPTSIKIYQQHQEISDESTTTRQNQLCIQYGLRAKPNILDRLLRERHLQTPQDVYHATARKIGRLLKLTYDYSDRV